MCSNYRWIFWRFKLSSFPKMVAENICLWISCQSFLVSGLLELPRRWNSFSMVKVFKTLCPKHHPTGMNIIDLLAILPFYIELIQPSDIPNVSSNLHKTDSKEMLFTTLVVEEEIPRFMQKDIEEEIRHDPKSRWKNRKNGIWPFFNFMSWILRK